MNTKVIIGLVVIGGGVVAGAVLLQGRESPKNPSTVYQQNIAGQSAKGMPVVGENSVTEKIATVQDERYVPYTPQVFAAASDKRRVLYFHAPWCPTCRPLDKALSSNPNQIPEGIVLFKTDYDTETALKTKYAVTYQHTFVEVDGQKNAVQTWNGGDIADIVSRLR